PPPRASRPGGPGAAPASHHMAPAAGAGPPLTTLTADPRERGRQAAALLLQRLDEPDAPPRRTVAPVQLRIRESSAARPT
ncbi:substrate-binding domain-containing protein, partial [Stenotrophomonas maltophilia]|nr:substrate-binding domain-containing protein [Stenotrophomonas maltophilia]